MFRVLYFSNGIKTIALSDNSISSLKIVFTSFSFFTLFICSFKGSIMIYSPSFLGRPFKLQLISTRQLVGNSFTFPTNTKSSIPISFSAKTCLWCAL